MSNPRDEVYIWPTWLSKLLVGDNSCEWAAWFKAHYQFTKLADRDWTAYRIRHTALLNQKRLELEHSGYTVLTERQAEFKLKGRTGILHGRPDLIAVSPDDAVICELKTGEPYPSHKAQLMIYLYGLPLAIRQARGQLHPGLANLKGRTIDGVLVYENADPVRVPSTAIEGEFKGKLTQLLRRISDSAPATRVPSSGECALCPIPLTECPERAVPDQVLEAETDEF